MIGSSERLRKALGKVRSKEEALDILDKIRKDLRSGARQIN